MILSAAPQRIGLVARYRRFHSVNPALTILCLVASMGGCASDASRISRDQSSTSAVTSGNENAHSYPTDGTAYRIGASGRMRGYIESSRATDFCPGPTVWPADQRCIVTRGWDYSKGTTLVRTYATDNTLLAEVIEPGADLSLVPAEKIRVESLLRAEATLAPLVNRPSVRVWGGGFAFREPGDSFCDRGSRCVHAIAGANDGEDAIVHAIVDLMTDRVVYPYYKPAPTAATSNYLGN